MNKVFGIGLSRTGTLSLTHAMSMLGYKSCHFPEDMKKVIDFNFLCDSPIAANYKRLDKEWPGSKFILTIRELTSWLDSCQALWESHYKDFEEFVSYIHLKLYGRLDYNRAAFAEAYENHVLDVLFYFRNRHDDLLVIDICKGEGWEKLCPFLGKEILSLNFPKVNGREYLYKSDSEWIHEYR